MARARARRVAVAIEPEEERVAAELEQAAAVFVGDGEHRLEHLSDHVGDLLGALAPLLREQLGQLRESRDVDERGRAVDLPCADVGIVDEVLLQDARDVTAHPLGGSRRRRGRCDGFR